MSENSVSVAAKKSIQGTRNSKYELLRILSMIIIVACHAAAHGITQQIEITPQNYTWQLGFAQFFDLLGDVGNNLFLPYSIYKKIS